jgi:hypothetical protein
VKDGAGLRLWVSCRRCLLVSDQRLSRGVFEAPTLEGIQKGGVLRPVVWVGLFHPLRKWFVRKLFFLSPWAAGFGVRFAWVGCDFGGMV